MGQGSLLLVLLAVLTVGAVTYTTQRTNQGGTTASSVSQADDFAREAALVGLERMVRQLVDRPIVWTDTASYDLPETAYGTASYRARLVDYKHSHGVANPAPAIETAVSGAMVLDDTVTVESVGRFVDGRTGDPRVYRVRATYVKGLTDVGIPLPSQMAFASDQELWVNGTNDILQGDASYPANIHANSNLRVQGSPVGLRVEGTGSYSDAIHRDPSIYFHPPPNPDGTVPPKTEKISAVPFIPTDFSSLDLSTFEAVTTPPSGPGTVFSTGSDVINLETQGLGSVATGATGAGTADNPFQWYIDGSWSHNGDLRFLVNGMNAFGNANQAHIEIYVPGNFTLQGGSTLSPTQAIPPDETATATYVRNWIDENLPENVSLWIYVGGNISLNGNTSMVARLKANGEITFNGGGSSTNLIGGAEAIGDMKLNGGATVYNTLPASTGTNPALNYDVPEGVRLIAYTEWLEADLPNPAEAP